LCISSTRSECCTIIFNNKKEDSKKSSLGRQQNKTKKSKIKAKKLKGIQASPFLKKKDGAKLKTKSTK